MPASRNHGDLLRNVAAAIVQNPRSTLKELAEASGVSNATLHRLCGTREHLETILLQRAEATLDGVIAIARNEHSDYRTALQDLIAAHCSEHEFLQAAFTLQASCSDKDYGPYFTAMNAFFLNGQMNGAFRIDLPPAFLTTVFSSSLYGLLNSEHRGCIAPAGMERQFLDFFLSGIAQADRQH